MRVFQSQDPRRCNDESDNSVEQIAFRAMRGMIKEPPRRERIYAGFNGTVKENSERAVEGGKILSERTPLRVAVFALFSY